MAVIVRTTGDPEGATSMVRQIVGEIDRTLPLDPVRRDGTRDRRFAAHARAGLGCWRCSPAWRSSWRSAGMYGVTLYLVSERTREIGIRMAMGARSADILRAVLRGSLSPIGLGVALGLASAVWLASLLTVAEQTPSSAAPNLLFGVSPGDPSVIAGAAVLLRWPRSWRIGFRRVGLPALTPRRPFGRRRGVL